MTIKELRMRIANYDENDIVLIQRRNYEGEAIFDPKVWVEKRIVRKDEEGNLKKIPDYEEKLEKDLVRVLLKPNLKRIRRENEA